MLALLDVYIKHSNRVVNGVIILISENILAAHYCLCVVSEQTKRLAIGNFTDYSVGTHNTRMGYCDIFVNFTAIPNPSIMTYKDRTESL